MIELFNQMFIQNGKEVNQRREIRPYISQTKKNVTVACYMGKNCYIERAKILPFQWTIKDKDTQAVDSRRLCEFEKNLVCKEEQATNKILQ